MNFMRMRILSAQVCKLQFLYINYDSVYGIEQEAEYPFTAYTMSDAGTCKKSFLSLKLNSKMDFIKLKYKGDWSVFINGINSWG